jgi:hypothetical protein
VLTIGSGSLKFLCKNDGNDGNDGKDGKEGNIHCDFFSSSEVDVQACVPSTRLTFSGKQAPDSPDPGPQDTEDPPVNRWRRCRPRLYPHLHYRVICSQWGPKEDLQSLAHPAFCICVSLDGWFSNRQNGTAGAAT